MFIIVGADFCDQNDVLHNLGTPLRVCVVKQRFKLATPYSMLPAIGLETSLLKKK